MNINEKLLDIQNSLKAPKSQYNKFGGYHYRSCEDILESLKPSLVKNKVVLIITDEPTVIKEMIYIKATAILKDTESTEQIEVCAYAREPESKKGMDVSQITGSTSSYARKYALNGLFAIDDNKDADYMSNTTNTTNTSQTTKTKNTKEQEETIQKEILRKQISDILKVKNKTEEFLQCLEQNYKTKNLLDLNINQIKVLKEKIKGW